MQFQHPALIRWLPNLAYHSSAKRQRRHPLPIMASQWVERRKIQRRRTIENHIRKQPASKRADGQARGAKPIADHQSFHVTHTAK
jgi:hypothetical protein